MNGVVEYDKIEIEKGFYMLTRKKTNQKLKHLRKEKKITTKEIATMLGVSQGYYCMLENNQRRLYYDTAKKIAKIFDLKPDDIFYLDNE